MSTSESFNPYQAPESQELGEVRLGADAEFLISNREILCRESVSLPTVCLHTGAADDLVERSRTFHSTAARLAAALLVGVIAVVFFMNSLVGEQAILAVPVIIIGLILLLPLLLKLKVPGLIAVKARWYVNKNYAQRCLWRKRAICIAIPPVLFAVTFGAVYSEDYLQPTALSHSLGAGTFGGGIGIVLSLIAMLFFRVERVLRYSGRRRRGPQKGLFILTGHSRRFTETVERMIHGGF